MGTTLFDVSGYDNHGTLINMNDYDPFLSPDEVKKLYLLGRSEPYRQEQSGEQSE